MVTYRGVKYIRCPFDYIIYQMIIMELKPDLIIEIGTNKGGGALYMADLLDIVGRGVIHTIDIIDMVSDSIVLNHPRIKRFGGGYQEYDITQTSNYDTILVIDDGSHTYDDVKNSLIKFSSLPSKNSYFIIEDGIIDALGYPIEQYNGGPLKAIEEFLTIRPDYVIDNKWCNFFGKNATFNVNGYLRKI
jgi:cephalosporin hydroxylase